VRGIEGSFDVIGARAPLAFFTTLDPARLAHGYLFTGAPGVGKKTFARRLAQSLLCETPKATLLGYCETCVACKLFAAGTHPDFHFSEGMVKIGDLEDRTRDGHDSPTSRDLVRALSFHGYRSRFRIVVLGDIVFSRSNDAAADSMLKLFEEPPSGVVIILTTSTPGSLLPTIRSRFVELVFRPVPVVELERVLVASGVEPERATFAAEAALGSVTRARAILDEDDLGTREASFAWFADAIRGRPTDASFLGLDDRSLTGAEKRARVGELIELVRVGARDWAALALGDGSVPPLAADQRDRIASLPRRDGRAIATLLAAAGDAERLAATNVSASLVIEYLRIQLAPR
jgi:DNA polymerase-3 subunit delta'